jgi:hypothetical protein
VIVLPRIVIIFVSSAPILRVDLRERGSSWEDRSVPQGPDVQS